MKEYDYIISDTNQLTEYQQFYCEKGLCHVIQIMEDFDCYECEVLEPVESEGFVFYLEFGDKISLS